MVHKAQPCPPRPAMRQYLTSPAKSSTCIVEVEEFESSPARPKPITSILKKATASHSNISTGRRTTTIVTPTLTNKTCLTSSRTGTFYFAFGTDVSSSHLRSRSNLSYLSSSQPVALAKLTGRQWMVSSRGVPNIIQLCQSGVYSDNGILRGRKTSCDAGVVYGLVYNLDKHDEFKVDRRHGYTEHGPRKADVDLEASYKQPHSKGLNAANKRYERVEIVEWFSDPLEEGVNVLRGAMNVRCLMYIDESPQGLNPGLMWDDEVDHLSEGVSKAVRRYGMPQNWAENVMRQHGVHILRDNILRPRSHSRSSARVEPETRLEAVKDSGRGRDLQKHDISMYRDNNGGAFIETRIDKRITKRRVAPPQVSEFYRQKRGQPERYMNIR